MRNKQVNILLIEDNFPDQDIITEFLEMARLFKAELRIASSFKEGGRVLETMGIDLVMLDLSLPDSQGLSGFKELIGSYPEIPVVILTGLDDEKTAHEAIKLGAQDYLMKGEFDEKLLEKSILYAVERHSILSKWKGAMDALRKSEEKYKNIVENANDIIFETDVNGIFTYVNQMAEKITGYGHNELIGKNSLELVSPESRARLKRTFAIQVEKKIPNYYLEIAVIGKQNKKLWFGQNTGIIYKNHKPVGFQAVARDITDVKLAEEKAKKSEGRYKELVETMNEGLVQVDNQHKIQYVNNQFCIMTGFTEESLIGKNALEELIVDKKEKLWVDNITKLRKSGEGSQYELKIRKKDGDYIWCLVSGSPLTDKTGEVIGTIGLFSDITRKKDAETGFINAIVSAQEEERKRFAEELHDGLGQILLAAKMNVDVGLKYSQTGRKEFLENLGNAKMLLNQAIDEARNLAHIMMPKALMELGLETALNELFSKIPQSEKLKVSFKPKGIGDKRLSHSIELSLYRITQELLNNCLKHAKAKKIEVSLSNEKNKLILKVKDDGSGFRVDKISNATSLGLKNISSRVKYMQGNMNINAVPNRGTEVTVEVPVLKNQIV